ncbi:MAG TPA: PKD domain-containing protein [Prolixibacteraceae bacterium]|nr:PKD domain-containing protein [Prolixibacteraceae bacterium]
MGKGVIGRIRFACIPMFFSVFFYSCTSFDSPPKPSRNLQIGEETEVARQTVSPSGGSILVDSPGSEVDGMKIEVPAGSYTTSRTFRITTAPITSHNLGEYFVPVTPVIQIENGGGYTKKLMKVTIPVTVPDGEIAVGFLYHEISGTLEGLNVVRESAGSITVATRHFMSETEIRRGWDDNLKGAPLAMNVSANLIICSVKESILESKPIISSGFTPGVDDWEFINYGSYLEPGGHCAGQSVTAMWYYFEKKLAGEAVLYHRFDSLNKRETPQFMWMDNRLGYRFASVIQNDFKFDGWFDRLDTLTKYPELVFNSFAASMLVTGEPQLVLICSSKDSTGHAMIVYKVDYAGGDLYIADPNYPNNHDNSGTAVNRMIKFRNGNFLPYETGLVAGADSKSMDRIGYFAKTAYIDWSQIGKRYNEAVAGTIGNTGTATFPAYTLWVKDDTEKEMENNLVIDSDSLKCRVECPTAEVTIKEGGRSFLDFQMFNKEGDRVDYEYEGLKTVKYTLLNPGLNTIGFYVAGPRNKDVNSPAYIDFKWVNVYNSKLSISPNPIKGEPGKNIEITAVNSGSGPQKARYEWNFGDKTSVVKVKNKNTVTHKFSKEGTYTVKVELYDDATNSLYGVATAPANIVAAGTGLMVDLTKCKYILVLLQAKAVSDNDRFGIMSPQMWNYDGVYDANKVIPENELVWSGTTFTANYSYDYGYGPIKGSITGELSSNGRMIKTLTASQTFERSTDNMGGSYSGEGSEMEELSIVNLPYYSSNSKDKEYEFKNEGPSVQSNVLIAKHTYQFIFSDQSETWVNIQSILYNSTEPEPLLMVSFSETY